MAEATRPANFWRDRRVFVTGGTGLVGGWLVPRLVELQADVVLLVRDWVPGSRLVELGLLADAGRNDDRRRYYRLTTMGRAVLKAETARLESLVRHAHACGIRPSVPSVMPRRS